MKKNLLFLALCLCVVRVLAIEPATNLDTYYAGLASKSGDNIVTTLQSIISANYNGISYSGLEPYYEKTDFKNGTILDMYSTCSFNMSDANCSQKNVCDCWNKEHSVPQSWFNEASPMKSDLFHVYPTDARVNNFRSNYPYGETDETSNIDHSPYALGHLGSSNRSGYSGKIYEPDAQYKGDFARTYLYMVTRYADKNFTQSAEGKVMFNYSNGRAGLTDYSISLLLKWHREDPVSEKEVERNNAVYGIQKNRNPYIDYPYLVEYVWGKEKGKQVDFSKIISAYDENFVLGESDGSLAVTDPTIYASEDDLEFMPILAGQTATLKFTVRGLNLTSAISLAVSGEGFSVSPTTITATAANSTSEVVVSFRPTVAKTYMGNLSISSTGAQTVNIPLRGVCATAHSIQWLVNGTLYTDGDPTTTVVEGNMPQVLPTAPTNCDTESSQFVGWTATPITGSTDDVPSDLFAYAEEAPVIMKNTSFYAVFAKMDGTADKTDSIVMANRMDITGDVNVAGRVIAIDADKHVTFVCDGGGTAAKYYPSAIRLYGGGTLTISADATIGMIEIDYEKSKSENDLTVQVGKWTTPVWRGDEEQVVFTVGGSSGHVKLMKITVTYGGGVSYSRFITSWECGATAIETPVAPTGVTRVYSVTGQYVMTIDASEIEHLGDVLTTGIYMLHTERGALKVAIP